MRVIRNLEQSAVARTRTIFHERRLQVQDLVLQFALLLRFDVEDTTHFHGVRLEQLILLEQLRDRVLRRE